jgi:hypothetical protein
MLGEFHAKLGLGTYRRPISIPRGISATLTWQKGEERPSNLYSPADDYQRGPSFPVCQAIRFRVPAIYVQRPGNGQSNTGGHEPCNDIYDQPAEPLLFIWVPVHLTLWNAMLVGVLSFVRTGRTLHGRGHQWSELTETFQCQ